MNIPEINIAIRIGDTSSKDRQKMLKKPPHILRRNYETIKWS